MDHTCKECGLTGVLPWNWPTPHLCGKCAAKLAPLACPFCGCSATRGLRAGDVFWIECVVCRASGPSAVLAEQALPGWNRRRPPNPEPMPGDK